MCTFVSFLASFRLFRQLSTFSVFHPSFQGLPYLTTTRKSRATALLNFNVHGQNRPTLDYMHGVRAKKLGPDDGCTYIFSKSRAESRVQGIQYQEAKKPNLRYFPNFVDYMVRCGLVTTRIYWNSYFCPHYVGIFTILN